MTLIGTWLAAVNLTGRGAALLLLALVVVAAVEAIMVNVESRRRGDKY